MVIFAAGNKYKMYQSQTPRKFNDVYFVFAFKMNKSTGEWRANPSTYNIGPYYEVVEE